MHNATDIVVLLPFIYIQQGFKIAENKRDGKYKTNPLHRFANGKSYKD